MSMFSGRIGQPEGAFRLLDETQRDTLVSWVNQNFDQLQDLVNTGSTNTIPWARVAADGTLIIGNGITAAARSSLGQYTVTLEQSATATGSDWQMATVVTPMTVSGSGGDGITTYKAYSGNEASAATDTTTNPLFFYNSTDSKFYLLGENNDTIYIHDTADWTATPTQEDPGADPIRAPAYSGCLDQGGDIVWLSGDSGGSPYSIRAYTISTDTHTDFGSDGDRICIGGRDGYVVCIEPSYVRVYQPNFSTPALGAATQEWNDSIPNSISNVLAWDGDGYGWTVQGTTLWAYDPTNSTRDTHTFPWEANPFVESGTKYQLDSFYSPPIYDSTRRCLYISLYDASSDLEPGIFRYSGWVAGTNNSGVWERVTFDADKTVGFVALGYDASNDVIIAADYTDVAVVKRYRAEDGTLIDTVSVDDQTTPDNPQVDYDIQASRMVWGVDGSVYVSVSKSGVHYIVRIDYNGAEIDIGGSGGGSASSALVANAVVNSATQVGVNIYRISGSGFARADAQFSVHVGYK